jgi:hypothetical protein
MNTRDIFESCGEFAGLSDDNKELLDKIMNIKTPMDFDDDFVTDTELQTLESELDRMATHIPQANSFKEIILMLPAVRATKINFI